jgi:hypothetical protein
MPPALTCQAACEADQRAPTLLCRLTISSLPNESGSGRAEWHTGTFAYPLRASQGCTQRRVVAGRWAEAPVTSSAPEDKTWKVEDLRTTPGCLSQGSEWHMLGRPYPGIAPIPGIARVPLTSKEPQPCAYCGGRNVARRGTRRKQFEIVRLWRCAACKRTFTPGANAARMPTGAR